MNVIGAALFLATLASDDFCTKQLDQLLAWHIHYGLPLPPPDAALVKCAEGALVTYHHGLRAVQPGSVDLGFTLDGSTIEPGAMLFPLNDKEMVASIQCVKPDPSLLHKVRYTGSLPNLAVIAHQRKWKPLALAAFRKLASTRPDLLSEKFIARWAYRYWTNCFHGDPDESLSLIAKYMKRSLPLSGRDGRTSRELLRAIELAARPRDSAPGTDAALIDDLVDLTGWQDRHFSEPSYRSDPRYRALVRRGFEVVPVLILHLDDERATRAKDWRGNALRVKDIVFDILEQLHGEPFDLKEGTLGEQRAVVSEWFAVASRIGEERYVASQVLGEVNDIRFRGTLFWLLTEKYPHRLPDVFRRLIDTRRDQHWYAWEYAKAIVEAPIPEADKRKILEYAAIQDGYALRAAGISCLRPFDPKLAKGRLLLSLVEMPNPPSEAQIVFVQIAAEGTDPDEWKAVALTVRQADGSDRYRLLNQIWETQSPAGRKHRLAFLAEYLTDDGYDGQDRWGFPKLDVRNFVAIALAALLDIDAEPNDKWTAAQWAALRERVEAKVKEELLRQ